MVCSKVLNFDVFKSFHRLNAFAQLMKSAIFPKNKPSKISRR